MRWIAAFIQRDDVIDFNAVLAPTLKAGVSVSLKYISAQLRIDHATAALAITAGPVGFIRSPVLERLRCKLLFSKQHRHLGNQFRRRAFGNQAGKQITHQRTA